MCKHVLKGFRMINIDVSRSNIIRYADMLLALLPGGIILKGNMPEHDRT
jgi:hypothetical protein